MPKIGPSICEGLATSKEQPSPSQGKGTKHVGATAKGWTLTTVRGEGGGKNGGYNQPNWGCYVKF